MNDEPEYGSDEYLLAKWGPGIDRVCEPKDLSHGQRLSVCKIFEGIEAKSPLQVLAEES